MVSGFLWILAFHIIFMVTWFAGLFYLPRLFVYHAMTQDENTKNMFKVMERKLYIMMNIGGVLTIIFGIWLTTFINPQVWWFAVKIALVALLIIYHLICGRMVKTFAQNKNNRSHLFYRYFNEVPAVFLIVIVLLVILKPW